VLKLIRAAKRHKLSAVTVNGKAVRFAVCFKCTVYIWISKLWSYLSTVMFVPNAVVEAVDVFQNFKIILSGKKFKIVYKSAVLVHISNIFFFYLLKILIKA
jgi:hypothetical protein